MNNFPLLEKVADTKKLHQLLSQTKPYAVLHQWAETAGEIEPTKSRSIAILRSSYAEMHESSLDIGRLLLFVENILEILDKEESRCRLIAIEAFSARKS